MIVGAGKPLSFKKALKICKECLPRLVSQTRTFQILHECSRVRLSDMARRPAIRTLIWILAGFALLVALGACCWRLTLHAGSQPHPYADQPRLKVDTSHRDLGSVYPGDKVELQYPLEN